jgi:hypothetical protein
MDKHIFGNKTARKNITPAAVSSGQGYPHEKTQNKQLHLLLFCLTKLEMVGVVMGSWLVVMGKTFLKTII